MLERLEGPYSKPGTVEWFGSNPDRWELAQFISPIKYVREGLPPIITIHGDQDPRIPIAKPCACTKDWSEQASRTGWSRSQAAVMEVFSEEEMVRSYVAIRKFLGDHVLKKSSVNKRN